MQLAQIIQDTERRFKKASASNKESAKFKKISKAQDRELNKMKQETNNLRLQNDDYKTKIDELIKKQANIRSNVPSY